VKDEAKYFVIISAIMTLIIRIEDIPWKSRPKISSH
jgi:hypothetical protein